MAKTSLFFISAIILILGNANAQVLKNTAQFSLSSPFIETDKRVEMVKINKNEFVILAKTKGNLSGNSRFVLEKYNQELETVFSEPLTASANEDYKELFFNGEDIILFSVNHNTSKKTSHLIAYGFDISTGEKKWEKTIQEKEIAPFTGGLTKGKVKESFENSISSCLKSDFVPHFQYQYQLVYSPDSNLIMSYIYDYGQNKLLADAVVFDRKLNVVHTASIPIDNNFTNYGLYINNKGEVYILNADRAGRIVLIKYDIPSKEGKLLDIKTASTHRENLVLKVFSDDIIYVANTNLKNNRLAGIMYSKFDFKEHLVEKIHYHEISTGLKQTLNALRDSKNNLKGKESWENYHITDFIINEYEKIILVLEKREILSMDFAYQINATNDPDQWVEKQGKVNTEAILMFSFNMKDDVLWENVYLKSQLADVSSGLNTTSFNLDNTEEGKIRIIYGSSEKDNMNFNLINYIEYDEYNGNKLKDIQLENEDKLTFVRNYTVWNDKQFIIAGKKGVLGKKSFLYHYKF
ncbi:hypothetical protein RCC89_06720 [Cytophagaceae bacterium ABcell3]|nr:hypothetical protein RCC89_06720 [Cytophagaceae bacterium ABcell3]